MLPGVKAGQQRGIVDDRPTAGVNQDGARLQSANQCFISQMQGLVRTVFKQRRMESQYIGVLNQFVQRAEIALVSPVSTRRIAK